MIDEKILNWLIEKLREDTGCWLPLADLCKTFCMEHPEWLRGIHTPNAWARDRLIHAVLWAPRMGYNVESQQERELNSLSRRRSRYIRILEDE